MPPTKVKSPRPEPRDEPNGQQKGYVVLSAEERTRGLVRRTHTHLTCGTNTSMAETLARDPGHWSSSCGKEQVGT